MSHAIALFVNSLLRRVRVTPGADSYKGDAREVRLLSVSTAAPVTPEQCQIVNALVDAGPLRIEALVGQVTTALYREELRLGGAVVDLGFLGPRLFARDVLSALKAGDGCLWTISMPDSP